MSLRWTPEELAAYEARKGRKADSSSVAEKTRQGLNTAQEVGKRRGVMNSLEARFEKEVLSIQKLTGEVLDYKYEAITLRLAKGARYTPDFPVWPTFGKQIMYEVKGYWREAARVRIKVAAELYPHYRFIAVRSHYGKWVYEEF